MDLFERMLAIATWILAAGFVVWLVAGRAHLKRSGPPTSVADRVVAKALRVQVVTSGAILLMLLGDTYPFDETFAEWPMRIASLVLLGYSWNVIRRLKSQSAGSSDVGADRGG
jgi:hypothetical protein